jgi:hypothetical protein
MTNTTTSLRDRINKQRASEADKAAEEKRDEEKRTADRRQETRTLLRLMLNKQLGIVVKDASIATETVSWRGELAWVEADGFTFGAELHYYTHCQTSASLYALRRCPGCRVWLKQTLVYGNLNDVQVYDKFTDKAVATLAYLEQHPESINMSVANDSTTGHVCKRRGWALVDLASGASRILEARHETQALAESLRLLGYGIAEVTLPEPQK